MKSGLQGRNRLLLILAVFMACVVVALLSLYLVNRITQTAPVIQNIDIDSKTLVSLGVMHQTSTRNGIKEWSLEAASARILKQEHLAVLTDVSVHFFFIFLQKKSICFLCFYVFHFITCFLFQKYCFLHTGSYWYRNYKYVVHWQSSLFFHWYFSFLTRRRSYGIRSFRTVLLFQEIVPAQSNRREVSNA